MNPFYFNSTFPMVKKKTVKTKKHKFSKEDDIKLENLVAKYGSRWSVISKEFKGRTPRQCRDRWNHYLDPKTDHSEWTKEEDQQLISCYRRCGNHWSLIAENFPKRTSVSIRNRCCKLFKLNDKNRFNYPQFSYLKTQVLMPAADLNSEQLLNQISNMTENFGLPNDKMIQNLFCDDFVKNDDLKIFNNIEKPFSQESQIGQAIQTNQPKMITKSLNCEQNGQNLKNFDKKFEDLSEKLELNCKFSDDNNSKKLLPPIDSLPFPY